MSSSGSRGGPSGRYKNDFKPKRKMFYPKRANGSGGGLPGSSSLSHSRTDDIPNSSGSTNNNNSNNNSNRSRYLTSPSGPGKNYWNKSYGTYYPSYSNYNRYSNRPPMESRTSSSNYSSSYSSPNYSRPASNDINSNASGSGFNSAPNSGGNPSISDSKKSFGRSFNNRSSLSNSIPKNRKSNSLMNSGGKKSDTYYPSSKGYGFKSHIDHYSSDSNYNRKSDDDGSNSRRNTASPDESYDHNSRFDDYRKYNDNDNYNYNYNYNYNDETSHSNRDQDHDIDHDNKPNDPDHGSNDRNKFNFNDVNDHNINESDHDEFNPSFDKDQSQNDQRKSLSEGPNEDIDEEGEEGEGEEDTNADADADADANVAADAEADAEMPEDADAMETDTVEQKPISDMDLDSTAIKNENELKSESRAEQVEDSFTTPKSLIPEDMTLSAVKNEGEKVDPEQSEDIDGCVFPLPKMDGLLEQLKDEFQQNKDSLKYSISSPVKEFSQYPFYKRNLIIHELRKLKLFDFLSNNKKIIDDKNLESWKQYKKALKVWELERVYMDDQLRLLNSINDEKKRELELIDVRIKNDVPTDNTPSTPVTTQTPSQPQQESSEQLPSASGRRSRRHGDLITSEAEFEEILKNLSKQDEVDPMAKALRGAAPVPDLISDPFEKKMLEYLDCNNIVTDKRQWASRVRSQFFDNFSAEEHSLFCEAFVKYPKKFGYISRYMGGLRSSEECVIHYYLTKKGVNYKNLIFHYKKKLNKKLNMSRKGKQVKGKDGSVPSTPVEITNEVENEDDMPLDKETTLIPIPVAPNSAGANDSFSEELYTETGRRKRAAAPSFDGTEKKDQSSSQSASSGIKKKVKKPRKDENQGPLSPNDTNVPVSVPIPVPNTQEYNEALEAEGEGNDNEKDRRKTISSYWSIIETNAFPGLLQDHGTKWTTIADKLTTKTATMVRNYFQRNAEKHDWFRIAEEADKRLEEKFAAVLAKPEQNENEYNSVGIQSSINRNSHESIGAEAPPLPSHQPPIGGFDIQKQYPQQIQGVSHVHHHISPPFHHLQPLPRSPLTSLASASAPPPPLQHYHSMQPLHAQTHVPSQQAPQKAPQKAPQYPQLQQSPHIESRKPSIGSLLSTKNPDSEQNTQKAGSIMSLLNAESSPAKSEASKFESVKPSSPRNNINSLLNSPSSPVKQEPNQNSHPSISPS